MKPKDTLMEVMGFLLESKDLEGTNLERRIDQVLAMGQEKTSAYKLKSTSGKFDAHAHMFTPEQRLFVENNFGQ